MLTTLSNSRKGNRSRTRTIFSLTTALIVILATVIALFAFVHSDKKIHAQNLAGSGFSFTAAGDYSQTNYTTANLNYIAKSGAKFNLGLGDFSYNPSTSAAAWSSYAKNLLPANFPFEIVGGDHDSSDMKAYAADLPNHIGQISGTYAKQYYFDYPSGAPLARLILISPSESGDSIYSKGGSGYNWVSSAIDGARAANIHWVIVAMYEYCFVIDSSYCSNQSLLDLLLSKHVDLILQAHKHTYQASKQLALNSTTCQTLSTTKYNPSCVANASTSLTRGAGSVIVVTGTGGEVPQLAINTSDPKIGYFRKWMGANVNETWGVTQVWVSGSSLNVHFVGVSGPGSDSFSIHG